MDVDTIMRVQREHDRDVISEAYEVFVAELATTRLDEAVRALPVGLGIELYLRGGVVVRGRTGPAVVGWVCVEIDKSLLLVPMSSVGVLQPDRATRNCTAAPSRSVCSVLREHHACGGSVRLWWPDGTRKVARLSSVCADYVVLESGSWVPLAGLQACELL